MLNQLVPSPPKFDLNIYDPLRTSRDEELVGEMKENSVTKKYSLTLNRLTNMQGVLLFPITHHSTHLKSNSRIESMQLFIIALKSCPSSSDTYSQKCG